jgi:hypothetical protein
MVIDRVRDGEISESPRHPGRIRRLLYELITSCWDSIRTACGQSHGLVARTRPVPCRRSRSSCGWKAWARIDPEVFTYRNEYAKSGSLRCVAVIQSPGPLLRFNCG